LRLEGAYFVIVTLSFAQVLRLLANNWVGLTNGPMGVSGIVPPSFGPLVLQSKHALYYLGLTLAALGIAAVRFYVRSNLGRAAVAVRENRNVAHSVGIDPFTVGLITFVLAAFLAGIAGAFYGHYITFVGPEIFGFGFMASMLIMVLAGGQGTLVGPILGALLVTLLQEYLRAAQEIRLSLFGALLMLLVLVMPRGLAGLARSLRRAG
jgi:branched-chain amino acid transport system permease protein